MGLRLSGENINEKGEVEMKMVNGCFINDNR